VLFLKICSLLMFLARPTGWHGESGNAARGGHLAVDFYRANGRHFATHHVYPCDKAYGEFFVNMFSSI
jgi:hypothetical protein